MRNVAHLGVQYQQAGHGLWDICRVWSLKGPVLPSLSFIEFACTSKSTFELRHCGARLPLGGIGADGVSLFDLVCFNQCGVRLAGGSTPVSVSSPSLLAFFTKFHLFT